MINKQKKSSMFDFDNSSSQKNKTKNSEPRLKKKTFHIR